MRKQTSILHNFWDEWPNEEDNESATDLRAPYLSNC